MITAAAMSRRKQSRPRHVDNEGISLGVEADGLNVKDSGLRPLESADKVDDSALPLRKRSLNDVDNEEDDKSTEIENTDEFCPSDEPPSPDGCENISACEKCGVCFTDISHFIAHKKLCGSRSRILMPYDAPVNGYHKNGYDFSRNSLDLNMAKDFSDEEYPDDKDDFESMDEEERSRNDNLEFEDGEEGRVVKKRRHTHEEEEEVEDEVQYPAQTRPDQSFLLGIQNVITNSVPGMRERRVETDVHGGGNKVDVDRNEDSVEGRRKLRKKSEIDTERGVIGGNSNVTLEPLASTTAAVAQCADSLGSREPVPEEVSMFRSMLFQLQQQQMMQIQMIQQMRRQLIVSGVNPGLLPADIDLNMMSSEGLASVGAAMSGLQNATVTAALTRDGVHAASRSPSHGGRSRDSSPTHSESSHKGGDRLSSPISTKSTDKDVERLREICKPKEEKTPSALDFAEKYISPTRPLSDSPYCKDHGLSVPLTRNPLEILQEKTAASLSSLPLPLVFRSSSSMDIIKPPSSSSSLLNSSALFACSPSLSALQKETDALKPSPILPPINIPMSAEDYKGYIQRGTILERSQYASDDPFFKHKCRFCHKVFGSDSALQIHVRSHTGERPFKCNICGNRFSTKGNLKVHFERHKAKYPHIKMDATPVPEHLDRQPHLMPNFAPTPIPPSVPLPPPMPRMPNPSMHHGPISSPSPSPHIHVSHPSPFPAGFGGTFLSSMGPGLSPFGLMPPPRENHPMPFPLSLSLSLPSSLGMPLPLGRDSLARRESPTKLSSGSIETSVIRSPRKESPLNSTRDLSPSEIRRPIAHPYHNHIPHHYISHHFDSYHKMHSGMLDDGKHDDITNEAREESEKEQEDKDIERRRSRSRSRHESADSRGSSPLVQKSIATTVTSSSAMSSPPPPLLSRPSSHSPRQSPASVISWASLVSSQAPLLPSHHPTLFHHHHHHLPPGFPGLGLPLPGNPSPFPLPPPLNSVLSMPGPRLNGHSPFLPPPPPLPPHISPPPGEGSMFRNSILPTKTIDPSENLEQYMEVQKSETSKLEALVKNIEQKITDPNQCVVCHRVLSCKSALQMHYRIHTGERPFKCKICGRSFTTKGNLKTHMGVHRAKPALRMMHQCPVCHKQFTNVLVLQQHIRAHTGSMQHLPHVPLLPSHMDWAHRPPFGLNRHHPYLPPLHHDSHSLDLSGMSPFASNHLHRERSFSGSDHHKSLSTERRSPPVVKDMDTHLDESIDRDQDRHSDDDNSKEGASRPHSRTSEDSQGKSPGPACLTEPPQEETCHGKLTLAKPEFESAFLPPAFGNTPFDAPLAALEERVKAIDSQLSKTSFEKFRNSMGLDSAFFPNSSNLSNAEKNSEYGSDPASKSESPSSGGEMPSYGFSLLGSFDRNATTCNICLKTFACKSALDVHYRSHTKLKPYQCDVCDRSFSTRGNLKQHLLTHKIRDIPSSAFDDVNGDHNSDDDDPPGKDSTEGDDDDDDDMNELPNEDYPFEDDDGLDDEGLDPDLEHDEDIDNPSDDFNDPVQSEDMLSPSKSTDEFQEDNNNISSFQNHNGDNPQESCNDSLAADTVSSNSNRQSDLPANAVKSTSSTSSSTPAPKLPKPNTNTQDSTRQSHNSGQKSHSSESSGSSSNHHSSSSTGMRRHSGPKHQCMTCMKPFSSASALQIHTRTHTGDKPFKCSVCSKAFTTRGNLKVHMGTHMWNNSPSRRGRRMSIEPPFLLSHMKDAPFMPTGFPPRPPLDFFYQYPLPMMNGPDSKMNEISAIQNLGVSISTMPPMPHHLMQGFLPTESFKANKDSRTTSEPGEPRDHIDKKPSASELNLSVKVSSIADASPSRSTSSTSSSSLSLSVHPPTSTLSVTATSTPSPSNNKENSSTAALDLRNMRPSPWLWGSFPCHHCGQMFPVQDSLEHHLRTHHLRKTESPSHTLSKTEAHSSLPPKALLA